MQVHKKSAHKHLKAMDVIEMFRMLNLWVTDDSQQLAAKARELQSYYLRMKNSPEPHMRSKADLWFKNVESLKRERPSLLNIVFDHFSQLADAVLEVAQSSGIRELTPKLCDQLKHLAETQCYCDSSLAQQFINEYIQKNQLEIGKVLGSSGGAYDQRYYQGLRSKQWWEQLNEEWRKIFREALDIHHPPTAHELVEMLELQEIDCSETYVRSLEPLNSLQNLRSLNCYQTPIRSLEPLRDLASLQKLDCWGTQINSLEPLRDLVNLQCVNCNETQVTGLGPLQNAINLEILNCSATNISTLEPLRNLTNLQCLICGETQIKSLEPLRNLTNLQRLSFGETHVKSLEPLQKLTNLQLVYCSDTPIKSLESLRDLPNLQTVYCANTHVSMYELGRFKTEFSQCKIVY
jgi:internalin A